MITVDFKRLGIRPGYRILDIGCGSGRHTTAAYCQPNVLAVGADRNPRDLVEARNRLNFHDQVGEHGGGAWALTAADITNLPFKDNRFDLVICSEVLEHIPDHHRAVREIARVLKPDRWLAISVPRYYPERICWALAPDYGNANQGHIRIYTKKRLIRLIEQTGVRYRGYHYAHGLHSPYWWLKCAVGPTRDDHPLVKQYHRFLTWDIMSKPRLTRVMERALNPVMGKSLVVYFYKK